MIFFLFADFRNVIIRLKSSDIRTTVTTILKACDLPLDYLETVPVRKETTYKIEWITPRKRSNADIVNEVNYTPPKPKTLRFVKILL